MNKLLVATTLSLLATSGHSFAKDVAVSTAELQKLVVGKTIISAGDKLKYGADGSYTYNGQYPGTYAIGNGTICVQFNSGGSRCDKIVKSGGKYILINSQGRRFPFGR